MAKARHGPFPLRAKLTETLRRPCLGLQSVQLGKQPFPKIKFQAEPRRKLCRAARSRHGVSYIITVGGETRSNSHDGIAFHHQTSKALEQEALAMWPAAM